MFSINYNIVYFTLFYVFRVAHSLVELPAIEDYYIAITETVIRNTVNDLFATFKVRGSRSRPKLKKYSVIHNFFVSITLKDCDSLKKIVKLSQVNNIDNNTLHFIAQINEVLDESDNRNNAATDDIYVNMHIEKFIKKLRDLKQIYQFNEYFSKHDINEKILEHLSKDRTTPADVTNETNKTNDSTDADAIDNNDDEQVWTPVLQSGRRIFNGHRTHITHYPFIASVLLFDKFHCAGSIIRTDLVITAASCLQLAWNNRFFRENPAFLSVQIGSDFYEAGGENIPVLEIYFHPEYDPRTLSNNIALMRLTTHIRFSKVNKKVKRIDFDQHATPLPVDTGGIIIVGWGAKDNTGNIYNPWESRLSYAELDYYPFEECQEIYTKDYVTRKHFCAGFFTKPTGACQHDVGGPGVYRGYLIGVISFGPPICGTVDAPTVFTKVGFYKDWINKVINSPAPYIKPRTTLLVSRNTFKPVYTKRTTKAFKIEPIMIEPPNVLRRESLRILEDDKLFKEFLLTMFKQKEINNAKGLDKNIALEKLLRYKDSTKTPTTNATTTNTLSQGGILDVVANKLLDFMGINKKQTTTETPLIEVIENHVNIDVKSNAKVDSEKKFFGAYSDEENSDKPITKYSKLNKAKPKFSTTSTYPLFVGIEYNDNDSEMSQPKFKASDKGFELENDDSFILKFDDEGIEKISKQRSSKLNKSIKVKGRASVEYKDITSNKLDKTYDNIDDVSELDFLVKDILEYVEEKPIKPSKSKKDIIKKTRSKYSTPTSPLFGKSVHRDKYNKTNEIITKYKNRYEKNKAKTTATADIILSPVESEYEDEDNTKDGPKMRGTDTSTNSNIYANGDDFVFETNLGETNSASNKNDKISSQHKVKKVKKVKSRNATFVRETINVEDKNTNTATSTTKKIHKNVNENINTEFQLDSLVKDIFEYIEGESTERIISQNIISEKKHRQGASTATKHLPKKIKHENINDKHFLSKIKKKTAKNKHSHANQASVGDSTSELDISKLEDRSQSSSVKKPFLDSVEYEDKNVKIIEPKMVLHKIPRKSKHKHAADENTLETDPKKIDSSREKMYRGKSRSSKNKYKPKYATDSTVFTDQIEYEDEDGKLDIKTDKVSKHSKNKKSNIDDDSHKDTNAEEDGSNDSKLENDITELLDELDFQKIFESVENTVQIKGSKKKKIKGKAELVKVDKGQTSAQSIGGDGSSEAS